MNDESFDLRDGRRDTVVYQVIDDSTVNAEDTIGYFRPDEDRIDLSAIDADVGTAQNDAFHFIGDRAFSGVAGELRFDGDYVMGDINGDGDADLSILIDSLAGPSDATLHARDFVL